MYLSPMEKRHNKQEICVQKNCNKFILFQIRLCFHWNLLTNFLRLGETKHQQNMTKYGNIDDAKMHSVCIFSISDAQKHQLSNHIDTLLIRERIILSFDLVHSRWLLLKVTKASGSKSSTKGISTDMIKHTMEQNITRVISEFNCFFSVKL